MTKILLAVAIVLVFAFVMTEQRDGGVDMPLVPIDQVADDIEKTGDSTEEIREDAEIKTERSAVSGEVLDLSGQGLSRVPLYVFDRTDLQELDISDNELTGSLQAEVRHLQNLKVLDMSNNRFTGVPAEVGQLNSLEVLDLSQNQLTGLPHELGNLSNLKILDLRGNEYSVFDLDMIRTGLSDSVVIQVD